MVVKSKKKVVKRAKRAGAAKPRAKARTVRAKAARSKPLRAKPTVVQKVIEKPVPRPAPKIGGYRPRRSIDLMSRPPAAMRPPTAMVRRTTTRSSERRSAQARAARLHHQYLYMKAPGLEHEFSVGDGVEVYCDHEKNRERVRGWVKGIVVQVDNKMVAVQFRSNVFLTDGWMVPDRILWYPVNSEHIRAMPGKKIIKPDFVPEY